MTCAEREVQILSGNESADLESHLLLCSQCRNVQADLSALQTGLAELHDVDPALASEARRGALRSLRRRRVARWAGLGTVAAALLLSIPVLTRMNTLPSPPAAPQIAYALPQLILTSAKLPAKRVRARRVMEPKAEPMLVKIYTEDPDVVILWITD